MRTNRRIPDLPVSEVRAGVLERGSGPAVLVAISFDEASGVALRRGEALAKILEARLVVLHVVPPHWLLDMLFPHEHDIDASAMQQQLSAAVEATQSWCEQVLGRNAAQPTIILKRGRVAGAILEAARDVRASLIVLGDSQGSSARLFGGGRIAGTLIRKARLPVLVARPARPNGEIVAATNLEDSKYPALRQAARWGVRLGSHVTFVHSVDASDDVAAASFFGFPIPAPVLPREPDLQRRQEELDDIARFIGMDIDTVVLTRDRPADAILDVARGLDADLVVVGMRERRGVADLGSLGTALTVAREARRSVLTVPLDRAELSGWAS